MLLSLHNLARIDLLKVDIEGGEEDVIDLLSELDIGCIHLEVHRRCTRCSDREIATAWHGKYNKIEDDDAKFGSSNADNSLWCQPLP
mmetsp:Transcript_49405/g.115993  ORF Transcript_49405/g.115993 Transcript_49405/m.115993 type:complete len:87 (+) Transcript_49405:294-554(+)